MSCGGQLCSQCSDQLQSLQTVASFLQAPSQCPVWESILTTLPMCSQLHFRAGEQISTRVAVANGLALRG